MVYGNYSEAKTSETPNPNQHILQKLTLEKNGVVHAEISGKTHTFIKGDYFPNEGDKGTQFKIMVQGKEK